MNINLQQAREVLQLANRKATEMNVPVDIVVLDTGGHIKAIERMDGAPIGSVDIALCKAKTSMLFGVNSEKMVHFLGPEAAAYGIENTNGGLVGFAGGMPITHNGEIVGFIGISGGEIPEDFQIASAAAII